MNRQMRKQQIMTAAKKCFIYYGYKETGMRDIAKEAGVALGTLYSYYKNKEALFKAIDMPELADIRPAFEKKKEYIFFVAIDLFSKEGYDNVTMDAIAKAANTTRSQLYRFFSSKEDLFKQMLLSDHMVSYTDNLNKRNTELPLQMILEEVANSYFLFSKKKNQLLLLREVTRNSEKFPELLEIYYNYSMAGPCENLARYIVRYCHDHGVDGIDEDYMRRRTSVFLSSLQNYLLTNDIIVGINHRQPLDSFISSSVDVFMGFLRYSGYVS
ncbi:MAG: TetR/AcrR family transcriptional regulator [Lachnospiraceae bacterium]|nr:TetR/AcrR family transcriptional regulator [Lachnospiraceae bacterium]